MTFERTNKAVVADYVAAFNAGDFDRLRKLFTKDAVVRGVLGWGSVDDVMPIWRDLVRDNGGATEVVGVQMDAGRANAKPIDTLPFPVLMPGETTPEFLTKLGGVPCSIVVDGTGKIETLFYGPPQGKDLAALRDALKARG